MEIINRLYEALEIIEEAKQVKQDLESKLEADNFESFDELMIASKNVGEIEMIIEEIKELI